MGLGPVGDGDVDVGFAGPRLVVHGFEDGAGLDDVVEAADAGLVVANVLGADQPGAASDRVGSGAGRQMVVCFAEPIDAVVGHAGHVRIFFPHLVDIVGAALRFEQLGADERRVADDDIHFRPVGEQRVAGDEVGVEVVERQVAFADVEFFDGEFAPDHHGDFGEIDGKRVDVVTEEVLGAEETELALVRLGTAGELGVDALDDASFEAFQFPVGDVEEVAGAASGIEHAEIVQAFPEFAEPFERLGGFNLFRPRLNDGRLDDFQDVSRTGEMLAKRPAFFAGALLEKCAEDFRLYFRPIVLGDFAERDDFEVGEFHASRLREEAAIEIAHAFEPTAGDRRIGVHGGEEIA